MNLHLVQYSPVWEDKTTNKTKILDLLKNSKSKPDLIIFPEMTLTGFSMNSTVLAEELSGESIIFFSLLSKVHKCHVIAGITSKIEDRYFNTLFHFDREGNICKTYNKIHLFSFGMENEHYSSGSETVISVVDDFKIGFSICFDLRFPELFRKYALSRVDAIVNIACWPKSRINHYTALLKARAIENQTYVIGVNRTDTEPENVYNGHSTVFDPMGQELVLLEQDEAVIELSINKSIVGQTREKFPFLDDIKLI